MQNVRRVASVVHERAARSSVGADTNIYVFINSHQHFHGNVVLLLIPQHVLFAHMRFLLLLLVLRDSAALLHIHCQLCRATTSFKSTPSFKTRSLPTNRRRAARTLSAMADKDTLIGALWEDAGSESNTEDPSHMHIEMDDETGEPVRARFVYVDEHSCIGCTYCATTARSTFFMEEDHGRARVFDQAGDSEELVEEAIDSCPVSCIHYVSHEDLIILEQERMSQFIVR